MISLKPVVARIIFDRSSPIGVGGTLVFLATGVYACVRIVRGFRRLVNSGEWYRRPSAWRLGWGISAIFFLALWVGLMVLGVLALLYGEARTPHQLR